MQVEPASPGGGPHYVLFGLFGSPNLGNEATLAAFLRAARSRQPNARFTCVAPAHSRVCQMHAVDALEPMLPKPVSRGLWRLPEPLRAPAERLAYGLTDGARRAHARAVLSDAAGLFVPGTGVIDDFGQGPDDMPAHLLRWVEAARDVGCPVHFVSIGVSRVDHALSRSRFVRALDHAASFSVRDAISADNARRLGARVAATVTTDLAFSLPAEWILGPPLSWPPRVIGLGLIGFRGWGAAQADGEEIYRDYLARTAALARDLLARGYSLRLLIGDARADAGVADDLLAALGPAARASGRVAAPTIGDFRELLRQLGHCELVVAARYHNLLLSLMSGRAAVSIGYADKNAAVMADMGCADACHDIIGFDPAAVLADVDRIARDTDPRAALLERAAQLRLRLEAQYDRLFGTAVASAAAP